MEKIKGLQGSIFWKLQPTFAPNSQLFRRFFTLGQQRLNKDQFSRGWHGLVVKEGIGSVMVRSTAQISVMDGNFIHRNLYFLFMDLQHSKNKLYLWWATPHYQMAVSTSDKSEKRGTPPSSSLREWESHWLEWISSEKERKEDGWLIQYIKPVKTCTIMK